MLTGNYLYGFESEGEGPTVVADADRFRAKFVALVSGFVTFDDNNKPTLVATGNNDDDDSDADNADVASGNADAANPSAVEKPDVEKKNDNDADNDAEPPSKKQKKSAGLTLARILDDYAALNDMQVKYFKQGSKNAAQITTAAFEELGYPDELEEDKLVDYIETQKGKPGCNKALLFAREVFGAEREGGLGSRGN